MENRINYLLQQFQSGLLSQDERQELLVLAEANPDLLKAEIVELIDKEDQNPSKLTASSDWPVVLQKIFAVDKGQAPKKLSLIRVMKWLSAAVIVIAASFSMFFYLNRKKEHVYTSDVLPGNNKAILTLADGKKISLSDAITGDIAEQSGISISKTADGQIVYTVAQTDRVDEDRMNTISTPNGGEWQIKLPDGSMVWLNAASSLTYNLNLTSAKQRLVTLQGEAYFEVAKDKAHPFVVSTDKQTVEVLGTHFNINSYPDEKVTKTTLLEGSIRVSHNDTQEAEILKPGEQSIVSSSGISVNEVDTDEFIAWTKGYFMFNNERQESIMRKLSRWYNIEVEYADEAAKNVMYYGTVSRFEKVSKVLRKFEQTGEVRFDIKAHKIIVYKE
ncbi:FecR family protein [Pedobacter rhizosphaerae]|uniref:FecR family protein n=1 Tax=Pedobacter rhizosphaerae TaxID=390241 RepID=A0A1H9LCL0_9SPHI|nr:FecR family protein [Pedobacter rhizosphaerae]SER08979.1 FecR family protein [Pedobacter rhizosphaerae]